MPKINLNPAQNDDFRVQVLHNILLEEQNLGNSLLAGMACSALIMTIWCFILPFIMFPMHLLTLAFAYGTGYCMVYFGKGYQFIYGLLASFCTLFGFISAHVINTTCNAAWVLHRDFLSVLISRNPFDLFWKSVCYIPLSFWIFYVASTILAYWAGRRKVTHKDLRRVGFFTDEYS